MATTGSLQALTATRQALDDIRLRVRPLLETLRRPETSDDDDVAAARAGLALTLGTLRFLHQRLQGVVHPASDTASLRTELQRMRRLLVRVQERGAGRRRRPSTGREHDEDKEDRSDPKDAATTTTTTTEKNDTKPPPSTSSSPGTKSPAVKRRRGR